MTTWNLLCFRHEKHSCNFYLTIFGCGWSLMENINSEFPTNKIEKIYFLSIKDSFLVWSTNNYKRKKKDHENYGCTENLTHDGMIWSQILFLAYTHTQCLYNCLFFSFYYYEKKKNSCRLMYNSSSSNVCLFILANSCTYLFLIWKDLFLLF